MSDKEVPAVLMYHSITPRNDGAAPFTVSTEIFDRQMRWVHQRGFKGVSMRELFEASQHALEQRLIGLTFDDGFADFAEFALPILKRYGFTATVFVVAGEMGCDNDWAPEPRKPLMTAAQVHEVAAGGIEIGSHSLHHVRLTSLTATDLREQLVTSRRILQDISEQDVRGLSYPHGNHDEHVVTAAQAAGFDYCCAVGYSDFTGRYALPRIYIDDTDSSRRLWIKAMLYWLRWEYRGPGSRLLARVSAIRTARSRNRTVNAANR